MRKSTRLRRAENAWGREGGCRYLSALGDIIDQTLAIDGLGEGGADADIVGTTIEVDGTPRIVVGVTEPDFQYPPGDREVEIYMPMGLDNRVLPDRNHRMFDALARLDRTGGLERMHPHAQRGRDRALRAARRGARDHL